jgi:translation initiation factor IF-1
VTAQSVIRAAIVSNANTGIKAAAALSSRIAARRFRKGKGKFEAKAAAKVDEIVFDYIDFLTEVVASPADLDPAVTGNMLLARVTKNVGGNLLSVILQTGEADTVRIPGALRAKGKVSHKRHKSHVFGTGDVIIVEHGDAKGKFDSPALLALLDARFSELGVVTPAGFFSSAKDAAALAEDLAAAKEETGWEFDRSEQAAKLLKTRSLRPARGGAGAADSDSDSDEEVDIDAI